MNVVITMAGSGKRFRDAGYEAPKHMLHAHGKSLFWWSLVSLRCAAANARHYFVVRAEDDAHEFIRSECRSLQIAQPAIIVLEAPTDGQATTARMAIDTITNDEPIAIFNIDTHVSPHVLALPEDGACLAGFVPCFVAEGSHWSFLRPGEDGMAAELREKIRISDLATIGLYWFANREFFLRAYKSQAKPGVPREAGEMYVAPLYNAVIAQGGKVGYSVVPRNAVQVLGTPAELEAFRALKGIEFPPVVGAAS